MPKKKKTYDNNSISMLKGADRVRLRPGIIFGSNDLHGCIQGFFEILSNSIDEAKDGHGNLIEVTRFADGSIQVRDHGRGVPLDWNESEKRWNYDLVYNELYAGGKLEGGTYKRSSGLNGVGACATQYASEYFDVVSIRDGYRYSVHFEKGKIKGAKANALVKEEYKGKDTGTTQTWKPDIEVFTETDIPLEEFRRILEQQSYVNGGIRFTLKDEESGEEFEYHHPGGILEYVEVLSGNDGITTPYMFSAEGKGRDREDKEEYVTESSVAFCFNNKVQSLQYFHNSSWLEHGGSPDKAVRSAFVSAFDKEIKAQNKYNKRESKITFGDIQDSLILITNSFSPGYLIFYENQTKKAISNRFIRQFMADMILEKLQIWMIENKADADKAIAQILINKRSREHSEAQRITVKKKLTEKADVTNKVKKFVDCRSKDPEERECWIAEGDSALGSLLTARDSAYQALMPIRGKILNLEKASLQQVFQSDIILDLIRVFGCGVEVQGKKLPKDIPAFNMDRLNFNKIIIASDQDVDGFHIRCLVITMIYKLCPRLIEAGKVYFAETPLYEITYKNGRKEETLFAFSDAEKEDLLKDKDPAKIKIQRSKGLGENDAEMMALFMDPPTRRLVRVTAESAEEMRYWFGLFMGDAVGPRRDYIEENGHLYMDDLDVS